MPTSFCITVRFLHPYCHARADGDGPEWPPSPLRLYQALVAAAAGRWNERRHITTAAPALKWLESQAPPTIIAPHGESVDAPCQFYVPDNTADLLVPAWKRGETDKQAKRSEKLVRPLRISGDAVHYLYACASEARIHAEVLTAAARSVTHLGWGVDVTAGDAEIVEHDGAFEPSSLRWRPSPAGGTPLRVHVPGTLEDVARRHSGFLSRVGDDGFRPVPPLRSFKVVRYRRDDEPIARPYRLFELRTTDGERHRHPPSQLMHLAGMVRHLAIEQMKRFPPTTTPDGAPLPKDWVQVYIAGHARSDGEPHRQLSYLPLPSLGPRHADPGIRRIMITAPLGDDAMLDHIARRLAGQTLRPQRGNEFGGREPPMLVPVPRSGDGVTRLYTKRANEWHSFTPVILPGHDDHKPDKRRALIERALAQSGVELPCEFEWSANSRFPKAYSAHKYDNAGLPVGFLRPGHLLSQTAVHLTIRFRDGLLVPGPLVIGAGRHCGFGIFASLP